MTSPSGKDPAKLLAEALRARAGSSREESAASAGASPMGQMSGATPLTTVQLVLASLIAGLVVGILLAVLTLV